jgi:hypothetical protein
LAIHAVEQAIKETLQSQAEPTFDQMITLFLLIKNATIVNVQNDATERGLFQLGNNFGFNFLVKFDGLSYVYLGNFGAFQGNVAIWRLSKLLDLIDARVKAIPTRIQAGLTTEKAVEAVEFFTKRMKIWLIVAGPKEESEINSWLSGKTVPFPLEIFTLATVSEIVSRLP